MATFNHARSNMEDQYASITLEEEETGGLQYGVNDDDLSEIDDRWCLVGRFITDREIDFLAMQHKMASLWRPGRGLYVKELEPNLYLFQFYHEVDIGRVIEGSPWTFDRIQLVFKRLRSGENPRSVVLNSLDFWVQLHGMSTEFMSQRVVRDIANYIGSFVEADPNNFMGIWRDYLRVRVTIRVDRPLKRKMKLEKVGSPVCWAIFKYEGLPTFCLICGIIGHAEKFCEKLFDTPSHLLQRPYSLEMKAAPRRRNHTIGSRWLRNGPVPRAAAASSNEANGGGQEHVRRPPVREEEGLSESERDPNESGENHGLQGGNPMNHGNKLLIGNGDTQSIVVKGPAISLQDGKGKSQLGGNSKSTNLIHKNYIPTDETKRKRMFMDSSSGPKGKFKKREWGGFWFSDPPSIMNALSWNCRGLGNPWAFQFLKEIISQKKPKMVFLCETKCAKERVEWVGRNLGFEGVFIVEAQGRSGGLAFLWKVSQEGHVVGFSHHHIDFVVREEGKAEWRLTGVYGESRRTHRQETWDLLRTLKQSSSLPWCILGDLNNVVSQQDKRGGHPYPRALIEGFLQALNDCDLTDMELLGYPFTWERGRGTSNWVEVRLDRALISSDWFRLFPQAKLSNLETSTSDHSPIYLEPAIEPFNLYPRKFRFENAWLKEPLCVELIKDCWDSMNNEDIVKKIQACADKLTEWGKDITGSFKVRIKKCKQELTSLRGKRDALSVQRFGELKNQLSRIMDQRETFWKQRAKQFWLKEGDKNSRYFHMAATTRRGNNAISKLRDGNGQWVSWENGLSELIVDYYSALFSASGASCLEVVEDIECSISDMVNHELCLPVTEEEVRKALFQMHPSKSPGPDGMTPGFYQKCWSIVKKDVVLVVQKFFQGGILDSNTSKAHVVLIPKKKNPELVTDLRPIALCNVLYKIITKVMANRMKPFMDKAVSANQSAFIPGRLISDNILVSFEVLHYLKRKRQGKEGYMALKLDMSKAYDRIEWGFLEAVLLKLGFGRSWVTLILSCVTSASYTITHGGKEMGPILPTRGIRQGCPLSPYLFILCAEGLSALIKKYEGRGWLHGCKVANGAPRISHMLFADDSYLYCKATLQEALKVPWLPDPHNPFVSSSHPALSDVKVSSLMTPGLRCWDVELIDDLFNERDKNLILQIPLQVAECIDHVIWSFDSSGLYSVKSAYNILQQINGRWSEEEASAFWKSLWKLKIPPKIKNLMWRAGTNCLPTMTHLRTKRVEVSLLCPFCQSANETTLHCLVTCQVITLAWNRVGIGTQVAEDTSFLDWCKSVFSGADSEKRGLIAAVCWAIWGARNGVVWNNKVVRIDDIVSAATVYLNQWRIAQNSLIESSEQGFIPGDGLEHWVSPNHNSVKINVDAALFESNHSFGFGMVLRDSRGVLVHGRTILKQGDVNPALAEAMGVREALSWIKTLSLHKCVLETDSLVVVQAIRSSIDMISLFGLVIKDCKELLATLRNVSIYFVKRSVNSVAHAFARASSSYPDCVFSLGDVPTELLPILVAEVQV
uniref:Reverse transcriptase domain-containing protein n=1 Tax=Cannabis sativa TaxID=3483 RepID=A0A803PEK6_CANSA